MIDCWGQSLIPLTQTSAAHSLVFLCLTNLECHLLILEIITFRMYRFRFDNLNVLFWQTSRNKIGLLYNFSLGQHNCFSSSAFILSRRCASSESCLFSKQYYFCNIHEPEFGKHIQNHPLFFYWLLPRGGITHAYWPE